MGDPSPWILRTLTKVLIQFVRAATEKEQVGCYHGKTMNKYWLEKLEGRMPPRIEQAVKNADKAIQDFTLRFHLSHWHPISTAPHNQELELRIVQVGEIAPLEFPCMQTNAGQWINVDLGSGIKISPVEWRVWQRRKSPRPHHSKIRPSDRSSLFHRDLVSIGQGATD